MGMWEYLRNMWRNMATFGMRGGNPTEEAYR